MKKTKLNLEDFKLEKSNVLDSSQLSKVEGGISSLRWWTTPIKKDFELDDRPIVAL